MGSQLSLQLSGLWQPFQPSEARTWKVTVSSVGKWLQGRALVDCGCGGVHFKAHLEVVYFVVF